MTILDIYRDHVTAFFNSLMMCTTLLVSLNCKTVNNDITKNDIDHLLLAIRWTFTKQYLRGQIWDAQRPRHVPSEELTSLKENVTAQILSSTAQCQYLWWMS